MPLLALLLLIPFTSVDAHTSAGLTGSTGNGVAISGDEEVRVISSIDGSVSGDALEQTISSDAAVGIDGDASIGDGSVSATGSAGLSADSDLEAASGTSALEAQIATEGEVRESGRVETEEELEAYVQYVVASSPAVVEARTNDSEVVVVSHGEGRLLGVIPVTLVYETRVRLQTNGGAPRVTVALPWWHIFARKPIDEARVEQQMRAHIETVMTNRTQAQSNVAVKAQVIEAIATSFETNAEVATESAVDIQ